MNILREKNKKHGIIFKLLIAILAIGLISGVSAYFVVKNQANNKLTVGYVETEIVEDFQPPKELIPGCTITKRVKVRNTGPTACYVRVLVTFSTSKMEDLCEVDYNTTDWTKKGDYWYYNSKLSSNEITEPLFTTVKVKDTASTKSMEDFDINIYHESSSSEFND